ncbi:pyrimidine-nucleoside phosphorylase [Clostridium aminobutyricum]|uniref:Pyrimidine-nucleoside phosphorylase n=1 Tax=Clostridium aminobutyricum TaxID=33953 RepID=A0A939D7V5_CLOAM|nr:pyrimidine-nucleoside phosphorylase [Clostridium aminobutyricum]MBN7772731.1 pyrimidine-nucleoside phosphorylase [Clostridium aminobutyricum]
MNMNDIIYKKREGGKLAKEEIDYFVKGYTEGKIPDYQMSALLMAIFFQKMDQEETYQLTNAMKLSGDVVNLSQIQGIKVDKHSTGGVGDKTTLIVAPIAAACGVPIAKMSGRGLGFTGGTVDKMEAIPGFQTTIEAEKFINLVNKTGISVIGQTAHIAPADKKIYALRDVTSTVDNMSLISASIMSKKLASGSDAIVLDVKCGDGAFMQTFEDACELAQWMVDLGNADGKKTIAVVTDMNQPLGKAVGNSLEVIEAIETLKGNGPEDITELSLTLAGIMIFAGGKAVSCEEGYQMAEKVLQNGEALEKLIQFIEGQGGDSKVVNDYSLFPQYTYKQDIISEQDGYVDKIAARIIGLASQHAGAGRATKEDQIDLSAGIYLHKKVGDKVIKGEVLATVYGTDSEKVAHSVEEAEKAFAFSAAEPEKLLLIKKIIL